MSLVLRLASTYPCSPRRRGQIVLLFAVTLVLVLGMVAFGVDVGFMMVRRTEVQRAVDAAVLAAADYLDEEDVEQDDVEQMARTYLEANGLNDQQLSDDHLDIEFGRWLRDSYTFEPIGFDEANAIRIALNVEEGLFFGRVLQHQDFSFQTEAIAIKNGGAPPRDVMMVIDCSGSMDDDGGSPPQPISAVKEAAIVLCDAAQPDDHIGLTVYNWTDPALNNRQTGKLEIGLTDDREAVKGLINTLHAGHYASYTNIAGGIREGGETLRDTARTNVEKILIVLTDGIANRVEPPYGVPSGDLPHGDPPNNPDGNAGQSALGWATEVTGYDIKIYTVSLGASADHGLMHNIANIGGGVHYEITGSVSQYAQELRDVFQELGEGHGHKSVLVR
jgi:Mg-chelatase subunit ChlD